VPRIIVGGDAFVTLLLSHESVTVLRRYRAPMIPAARPPAAPRRPSRVVLHGDERPDDYAWMRQTDDPELLRYLDAENVWCEAQTAHLAALRTAVEAELAAALPDEDVSAPRTRNGWEYRVRRPAGAQYPVHVRRRPGTGPDDDEVVLDENALAAGHDFLELGVWEPSPDGRLLAYSVDLDGDEVYEMRVRDLGTGTDLPDVLTETYYGLAWSADGTGLLYTTLDEAYRPDTVRRHVLGTPQDDDAVVWQEKDRRFELEIETTRSGAYAVLLARSRDTTEVRLVPTDSLSTEPRRVAERVAAREYFVDHQPGPDGGRLVIVTDQDAPEYRVVTAPVGSTDAADWVVLLPHDPAVRVESADVVGGHVVVSERTAGRRRVRLLDSAGTTVRLVEPDATSEVVRLGDNDDVDAASVRLVREGWVRPPSEVEHDLATGTETLVHVQEVRRPLDGLRCDLVRAVADDGTAVPVSLVRRADAAATPGGAPCLLYGYGAYEASVDPEFWPEVLPLVDRGVTFAVAHVRGGGELGRQWWQQGRLLRKRTTFTDFVAAARHLVDSGVTTADQLVARGISAGGLLVGAVAHLAPEQFAAVVAEVPFVDVVGTMLDDTLPLTVAEWEEWGDPRRPEDYAYLGGYSPYDNLPGRDRPAVLVTASRHDPRVSVHEPAKWVARMRAVEAAEPARRDAPLLLRTAMGGAAHTGPAGRYNAWRHEAFLHAFVLDQVGLGSVSPSR
jgi:oligopeptidase B